MGDIFLGNSASPPFSETLRARLLLLVRFEGTWAPVEPSAVFRSGDAEAEWKRVGWMATASEGGLRLPLSLPSSPELLSFESTSLAPTHPRTDYFLKAVGQLLREMMSALLWGSSAWISHALSYKA